MVCKKKEGGVFGCGGCHMVLCCVAWVGVGRIEAVRGQEA